MPKILTIFVVFLVINFEQICESIKICLDKSGPGGIPSECPKRKELCDHPIYKNFMTEQCPKSCGRCALALANVENICRDNIGPSGISDCPKYPERCNDRIWGDFMRVECPFTCGLCNRTKLTLKPFKPRQISKQTTKLPPSASIQSIGENSQPIPPILSQLPSWGCTSLDCSLNFALDPCDDFFEFVCYGFTKNIENLPDGFTTKSQFNILWSQSYRTLIALLNDQNLRQLNGQNPFLRQMFLFYDSCRDKQKREIQKSDGLFVHLKEANFNGGQIHSFDTDWVLNTFPFVPFFSLESTWDVRPETTTKSMFLFKPAQTFANSGELKDEENRQKLAQKLTKILRTLMEDELAKGQQGPLFFGKEASPQDYETQIQRRVDNFIQMELQIRQAYDSYQGPDLDDQFADLRLPIKYLTLDQIRQSFSPQIDWLRILQSLSLETGLDQNSQIVVLGEELLISFGQLIEQIQRDNPQMMSDYLDWALIWRILKELDSRFVELMGSWAKNDWSCVRNFVRIYFAHWLDRLYLGNSFDKSVIPGNERILSYLKAAFSIVLDEAEWMDSGTKQKAHEKLAQLKTQIGYYALIEDDKLLEKLYANYGLVEGMPWAQMFARVHRQYFLWPTLDYRASYWVDGYYMWVFNSLAIYGALIHSPWYDPANPIVFNFGAMGTFMGHELTHGYDSNGWHFDGQGNRRRPEDLDQRTMERMEQRMDCFVGQYERYEGERKRANPRFTLSENIADNGAIRASYKAWLKFKAENREEVEGSRKPVGLEHFSDDQLFFISSAFMYCTGMPESDAETFASEDNHGFPRARVNLPLRNFDKFAQTFQCPVGSKMNPNEAERCKLW